MKKRILIIGINNTPELTGIGKYTGEMMNWMLENDYEITAISAFPYYPYWAVQPPYTGRFYKKETLSAGGLTIYRCPMYIPAKPSGLKRLIHEATFFVSAFFVVSRLLLKKRYEATICLAPPFHLGFLALFYRFFKKTPVIYHIQDLQVDAAKELGILKPDWIFSLLFGMERIILNSVDVVSTISEGMLKRVKAKTHQDVVMFPNWVDTFNYFPIVDRNDLKPSWGFRPEDKLVVYSGSIGEKQGLDGLIRIAEALKSHTEIKFIICGTGPFKVNLEKMALEKGLLNVHFLPLQSNEVFNNFLNMADIHLILQKGDASDLVMPSKLTTVLSVGGFALVTANPGTTLYEVITQHDMGVVVPPDNEEVLKESIVTCCTTDQLEKRRNAREYAERFLNKNNILKEVFAKIDDMALIKESKVGMYKTIR